MPLRTQQTDRTNNSDILTETKFHTIRKSRDDILI